MHIIHDAMIYCGTFCDGFFFKKLMMGNNTYNKLLLFFCRSKTTTKLGQKKTHGLCQETQGSGGFGFHQEFKAKIFQELKLQICDLSLNASENPSDYFSSVLLRIAMIVCVVFFLSTCCCSEILPEYDLILLHEFCVFQE